VLDKMKRGRGTYRQGRGDDCRRLAAYQIDEAEGLSGLLQWYIGRRTRLSRWRYGLVLVVVLVRRDMGRKLPPSF
jgi:hypothetical protein